MFDKDLEELLDNLSYRAWRIERDYLLKDPHTKPIYDPFEACKPTKTFLREVVKQLKQECYEIYKTQNRIKTSLEPEWFKESRIEDLQARARILVRRIKDYDFRIRTNNECAGKSLRHITESEKQRAKDYPIQNIFPGKLKKAGTRLLGNCPFHNERTPSFIVYPNNSYNCFGCGANGDSIKFIMKLKNINFIEAIKQLK